MKLRKGMKVVSVSDEVGQVLIERHGFKEEKPKKA